MKEEPFNYYRYFDVGLRLEVRFPRSQDAVFRDWAVISLLDEDLVEFQLSRDVLPENVSAETGTILDLRLGKEGSAYCCRAIVVSEREGARITARLIGEVVPDELREFYRIDAYIPLRYRLPTSESPEQIKEQWRKERYPLPSPEDRETQLPPGESEAVADTSPLPHPVAANLSGSGIRIRVHDHLTIGDHIPLELLLPLDGTHSVAVVGEVMNVSPLKTREGEPPLYSTALHFRCIDERDRDAVIRFISKEQLEHLRNMRGPTVSITDLEYTGYSQKARRMRLLFAFAIIAAIVATITSLVIFRLKGDKGEIEQTYEREIKKYRSIIPWH